MENYFDTEAGDLVSASLRMILENTRDMMFIKDINLVYRAASAPFVKMVGKKSADEIINRTDTEIFDDKNLAERYVADDRKLLAEGSHRIDYMEPITDEGGQARYGSTSKYILRDQAGRTIGILGITRDITREYIVRRHYQQELKYLFELPRDTYAVAYIDVDSWRIISQRRQLIGDSTLQPCYTVEELSRAAVESMADGNCAAAEFYRNFAPEFLWRLYADGKNYISFEYRRCMSDASVRWVYNEIRFLTDLDSGHLCAMLSAKDIDARMREEDELALAAKMDKMTMLLNRETTMESIRQILEEEARQQHALLMIDVDNFKSLNDTQGHQAGDEFLVSLAKGIRQCFRESDVIGRVGGDEFFVLMKNIPNGAAAEKKAKLLLDIIRNSAALQYPQIEISGSIGISLYPENGSTLEALYAKADSALYQAKRDGKNRFEFAD